jgi:hypothetical protein
MCTSVMSFEKGPHGRQPEDRPGREPDAAGRSGVLGAIERHVARWQRLCVETRCRVFERDS